MTVVKICGLTNLEDALCAWRSGADLLGFICVPSSPRRVAPAQVAEITTALRAAGCESRLVGVFAGASPDDIRRTVDTCALDLAQLHGCDGPLAEDLGAPAIIAVRVRDGLPQGGRPSGQKDGPFAYLLDTFDPDRLGGTGRTWDWSSLSAAEERSTRFIVAGGLTPDNVREVIRLTRPWGVDVSSGVEACPGRKDHGKVKRFIQNVREADAEHA